MKYSQAFLPCSYYQKSAGQSQKYLKMKCIHKRIKNMLQVIFKRPRTLKHNSKFEPTTPLHSRVLEMTLLGEDCKDNPYHCPLSSPIFFPTTLITPVHSHHPLPSCWSNPSIPAPPVRFEIDWNFGLIYSTLWDKINLPLKLPNSTYMGISEACCLQVGCGSNKCTIAA